MSPRPVKHAARRQGQEVLAVVFGKRALEESARMELQFGDSAGVKCAVQALSSAEMRIGEQPGFVTLALLSAEAWPRLDLPQRVPGYLGRVGGKAPWDILLLKPQRAADGSSEFRRIGGMARELLALAAAFKAQPTERAVWVLCSELAHEGAYRQDSYQAVCERLDERPRRIVKPVALADGMLVSEQHVARAAEKLVNSLKKMAQGNPFLRQADLLHVAELCGGCAPAIAGLLFSLAAKKAAARTVSGRLGRLLSVPEAWRAAQHASASQRLDALAAEFSGIGHETLLNLTKRFASERHLLAWLLEAHLLYDIGAGQVLGRRKLEEVLGGMRESGDEPSEASSGMLRKSFGLPRPVCEPLAAYLRQNSWAFAKSARQIARPRA